MSTWSRNDRGAGTVLVLGAVAVLLSVTLGGLLVARAVVASHQARLASDLSALAGASRLSRAGSDDQACAQARRVARDNGALLIDCRATGLELEVSVAVAAPPWPDPAVARARAGPRRDGSLTASPRSTPSSTP